MLRACAVPGTLPCPTLLHILLHLPHPCCLRRYQLNTEKLEYNYRVLVERDHENQATINQQKRKISRQRDILSGLKGRYAETDRKYLEVCLGRGERGSELATAQCLSMCCL